MKMKRSEYVFNLRRDGLTEAQANRAAHEADEAGVQWEEEPKSPKRIRGDYRPHHGPLN